MASHRLSVIFCLHLLLFAALNSTLPVAADYGGEEQARTALVARGGVKEGENNYYTNRDKFLSKLEPGDHIAAERTYRGLYDYEHHGIYEGRCRGYPSVVHFQRPSKSRVNRSCIFNCGYRPPKMGGRVHSCIDCFSKKKKMYKMQYRLQQDLLTDQHPLWDYLKRGKVIRGYRSGKYYREHFMDGKLYAHSHFSEKISSVYTLEDQVRFYNMPSNRSGQEVLDAAWHNAFRPYKLACNNCEHFAVFCKTGKSRSLQIEKFPWPFVCKSQKNVSRSVGRSKFMVTNGHKCEHVKMRKQLKKKYE